MTTTRIDIDNGKYSILHENGSNLRALRNGEPWQDLQGSGLVLAMAQEIEELREKLSRAYRPCKLYTLDGIKLATASAPFEAGPGRRFVTVRSLDGRESIQIPASFAWDRFKQTKVPTFYTF